MQEVSVAMQQVLALIRWPCQPVGGWWLGVFDTGSTSEGVQRGHLHPMHNLYKLQQLTCSLSDETAQGIDILEAVAFRDVNSTLVMNLRSPVYLVAAQAVFPLVIF